MGGVSASTPTKFPPPAAVRCCEFFLLLFDVRLAAFDLFSPFSQFQGSVLPRMPVSPGQPYNLKAVPSHRPNPISSVLFFPAPPHSRSFVSRTAPPQDAPRNPILSSRHAHSSFPFSIRNASLRPRPMRLPPSLLNTPAPRFFPPSKGPDAREHIWWLRFCLTPREGVPNPSPRIPQRPCKTHSLSPHYFLSTASSLLSLTYPLLLPPFRAKGELA